MIMKTIEKNLKKRLIKKELIILT